MDIKIGLITHREDYISIKDFTGDILNIQDRRWDKFFMPIIQQSNYVYFEGYRLNYFPDDYYDLLEQVSENVLILKDQHMHLLIRVREAFVSMGRGSLSSLWKQYEWPVLYFLKNGNDEASLVDLIEKRRSTTQMVRIINGLYVAYQGTEQNVLWLECSQDVPPFSQLYSH